MIKTCIVPMLVSMLAIFPHPTKLRAEEHRPTLLDEYEVTDQTVRGYGPYNLIIDYRNYHEKYAPHYMKVVGFSFAKKPDSRSNLPLRQFVYDPSGTHRQEITTKSNIYPIEDKYRNYRISSNQPYGTEQSYIVLEISPTESPAGYVSAESLHRSMDEYNEYMQSLCMHILRASKLPFPKYAYYRQLLSKTKADVCAIEFIDKAYLNEICNGHIGKIANETTLIIAQSKLNDLPKTWCLQTRCISHIYFWREADSLPRTSREGVWIMTKSLGWPWSKMENKFLLPVFHQ